MTAFDSIRNFLAAEGSAGKLVGDADLFEQILLLHAMEGGAPMPTGQL